MEEHRIVSNDAARETPALTGSLDAIPLFDLCQFLLLNRRTGTLTVRHGTTVVRIYFEEGMILDITDEALRSGEKLLLGAVQWRAGTFSFDPTPTGVERKIMESTEAILLDAARTIDEFRARSGEGAEGPTQELVFREKQTFAGELADAFRTAIEPVDRPVGSGDPLQNLLDDLQRHRGSLLLRGRTAILRDGDGVRPYTVVFGAEELLRRLHLPAPGRGEIRNYRFEKPPGWFHLRSRRFAGELQVLLSNLLSELPRPQEIGLDPLAYEPLLEKEGGLILWTGMPRGYRSISLACWLGHSNGSSRGLTLWLEESPRVAWEVASWISRNVGEPCGVEQMAGLLEWNPEILVVDPARVPASARLALEMAEAGTTTIAVGAGLAAPAVVGRFLAALTRSGVAEAGPRLAEVFSGAVGVLPLEEPEPGRPVVAAQVVLADAQLGAILSRGGDRRELEEWANSHEPGPTFAEEIGRLEREGKIDPRIRVRLRRDLPGLRL